MIIKNILEVHSIFLKVIYLVTLSKKVCKFRVPAKQAKLIWFQDGSVEKDACCQAPCPEFELQGPHGRRNQFCTLSSDPQHLESINK